MADIFVSYASEDRERVARIVEGLQRRGWSVWWDREIVPGGSFEEMIDDAIAKARCVVVAWSHHSIESRWVKNEALEGLDRDILVPVLLDEVRIPVAFRQTQAARFVDDDFDPASDAFLQLFDGVAHCLGVPEVEDTAQAEDRSIAVLAFDDLSRDHDHAWLADGIAEELMNALARIPELRVASRTDAFSFRDSNQRIDAIGRALGVASVLEGSLRVAGNRLRVTTQLINVVDGFHLWSETYDRDMDDIFAVQDDIAQRVVEALEIVLDPERRSMLHTSGTNNIEAFKAYREGFGHVLGGSPGRGIAAMERAIELDPDFVAAYRALANLLGIFAASTGRPPIELADRRRTLLEEVARRDPQQRRPAPWSDDYTRHGIDWNWPAREAAVREAVRHGSNEVSQSVPFGSSYLAYSRILLEGGLPDTSIAYRTAGFARRGLDLTARPDQSGSIYANIGRGDFEAAIRDAVTYLAGYPNDQYAMSSLTISYIKSGRIADARDVAARMRAIGGELRAGYFETLLEILDSGGPGVSDRLESFRKAQHRIPFFVGLLYHYLGDLDTGFEVWDEAHAERDQVLSWMMFMFRYAPDAVWHDVRFHQLLERMGLHEDWRETLRQRAASLTDVTGVAVPDTLPDLFG